MLVKIYGRMSCPYCVRAKQLAQKISEQLEDFNYEFIDMIEQDLSKEDIAQLIGISEVRTVPQVVIDGLPIGGCTDFQALAQQKLNISL